ncbi:MAG: RluA family pseudouridine synthase [Planctomycetes bacterium]|nr:RluA family pseudouridine synthase [Planctomycetota bacterium]
MAQDCFEHLVGAKAIGHSATHHCNAILSMNELFPIVFEDEDLLVINKPAGLVCHPTKGDEYSSLVGRIRLHLGKGGSLINRLDRETSGVVLVAKRPEVAGQLGKLWQAGGVRKTYQALVHGQPDENHGRIEATLGKDLASEVVIKNCVCDDGAWSTTRYRVLKRFVRAEERFSLLEVSPLTGRKHQIRIHLKHIGHPIVGDKIYGGDEMHYLDFIRGRLTVAQRGLLILKNHGLHAAELRFLWCGQQHIFSAAPSREFADFLP